jgi:hypothetical protein
MSLEQASPRDRRFGLTRLRVTQIGRGVAALAGWIGSLSCVIAMTLAAVGAAGAGATSVGGMADMGSSASSAGGPLGFLLQYGPLILLVSIAAMTLSLASRRSIAALPALVAGAALYWGMYGQDRLPVMYAAIIVGLLTWAAAFLWVNGLVPRTTPRTSPSGR